MTRTDLTDPEWERLESKLPSSQGKRGGQYKDHRVVLNGILWVLRTGAPWRDMPERYGKWKTCHDRLLRWRRQGVWELVLHCLVRGSGKSAIVVDAKSVLLFHYPIKRPNGPTGIQPVLG